MTSLEASVAEESSAEAGSVTGERGIASVNQARSLQSRLTTWLAAGLLMLLAGGFLVWYYHGLLARREAPEEARRALRQRTGAETALPPLGRAVIPVSEPVATAPLADLLGPPPELPPAVESRPVALAAPPATPVTLITSTSRGSTLDRQLKGAVFAPLEGDARTAFRDGVSQVGTPTPVGVDPRGDAGAGEPLGGLLAAKRSASVPAELLPSLRLLLPKGAFLDCTLETAIDSSLPGLTTCITATDTYGADGHVVLLERGSKLVGETRGDVRAGGQRLFVLWTEARTPAGVVIPLASPATDELGRSGVSGDVDRHFWARFGAAMLVSIVDGGLQAAARSNGGSTLVISPTGPRDLATEVLKETIRIPPTLRKPQGDRIQVLVARDLDFRSVYRLTADEPR